MKKLLFTCLCLLMGSTLMAQEKAVSNSADYMTEGMKVFKKKMRKGCRSTGLHFTKAHTKTEWSAIYEQGMLPNEAKTLCPQLDTSRLTKSEWDKIYIFVNEHSSDNTVIPEC